MAKKKAKKKAAKKKAAKKKPAQAVRQKQNGKGTVTTLPKV